MLDHAKRILGNQALFYNPLVANIDITTHASDFLWAVFSIMAFSSIALLFLAGRQPIGQRAFHQLAAVICATASVAYFCMASDLGATPIRVEYIRSGTLGANWVAAGVLHPTRSIWVSSSIRFAKSGLTFTDGFLLRQYARYIDWVITTPLLLLELLLTTGLPLSEIFTVLFFDEVMIVTGLIGALVYSQYKVSSQHLNRRQQRSFCSTHSQWGLFALGCAAEFYIWWVLFGPARSSATRLGTEFKKAYLGSAILLSFLWLLYPVCWGLADGGNVITPTSEMVFYGILDVIAKPVFCFYHCLMMLKCDYALLRFRSGKVSDGYGNNSLRNENNYNGAHNGLTGSPNHGRHSTSTAVTGDQGTAYPKGLAPTHGGVGGAGTGLENTTHSHGNGGLTGNNNLHSGTGTGTVIGGAGSTPGY
ncbi:hypothetical protein P7C70_g2229, partial [Phenoliferia sp. Uapishka_3]